MKIKDDEIKKDLIEKSQYRFITFWECDINNDINYIEKKLFDFIKNNN